MSRQPLSPSYRVLVVAAAASFAAPPAAFSGDCQVTATMIMGSCSAAEITAAQQTFGAHIQNHAKLTGASNMMLRANTGIVPPATLPTVPGTNPPTQPESKYEPEEVIRRLQKVKEAAMKGGIRGTGGQGGERFQARMQELVGGNLDQMIKAAADKANLKGLDEEWFQSLDKVIQEKKELTRLMWRATHGSQRNPLDADDQRRYQQLLSDYQKGAAMTELHTATLGNIYMAAEDKSGFFKSLPPSIQIGHNNTWTGGVGQKNPAAHVFAGNTYMQMGNPSDALAAYRKGFTADPNNAEAWAGSSAANLQLGNFREANADANKALQLDPGNQVAFASAKLSEGRGGGAGSAASGYTPQQAATDAYGRGFMGGGAGGGGGYSFGTAKRNPGAAAAARFNDQARSALTMGDSQAVLGYASKALESDPNNALAYYLRAMAYRRLGDWQAAADAAAKGLELAPKDPALLAIYGNALNRTKDYKGALAAANLALEVNPRDPWAFANRAYALGALGDREGMLENLRQAAAINPAFQSALEHATQAPTDEDMLFLFPGETAADKKGAMGTAGRKKSFGLLAGAAALGGLLLALGLLSTVLAPVTEKVASVFTRITRRSPAVSPVHAAAPRSSSGGLLRGQFELGKQIGAGGMGLVYEGTDRSLNRRVAVKRMRDEIRLDPRERARFVSEAKTVAGLHHPNIVDIYAIVEESDDLHLVFEYVEGRTVHELISGKGRFSPAETLRVVRGAADALDFAHGRGVIHRDMKPSNLMIDGSGRVKVMDFGIARVAKDAMTRVSMTQNVVGTPPYMAPEQEQGQVRKESDVYSLAVCAYELLCGRLPFPGVGAGMLMNKINLSYVPPSKMVEGLPAGLDDVFARAFDPDPDKRYHASGEFAAALESAVSAPVRA